MNWCLADVIKIYGEAGLRGRTDEWSDAETQVVYPDMKQPCPCHPAQCRNPRAGNGPCATGRSNRPGRDVLADRRDASLWPRVDQAAPSPMPPGPTAPPAPMPPALEPPYPGGPAPGARGPAAPPPGPAETEVRIREAQQAQYAAPVYNYPDYGNYPGGPPPAVQPAVYPQPQPQQPPPQVQYYR